MFFKMMYGGNFLLLVKILSIVVIFSFFLFGVLIKIGFLFWLLIVIFDGIFK